jgi:CheY-like chemotaxis protein
MSDTAVILLAEDDERDIILVQRAFKETGVLNPLYVVRDGVEAIAYLKGEGAYINRAEYPLPTILLLDLRMPRVNGFDVLRWIRNDSGMRNLRVVVLTGSNHKDDVNLAYQLGANSFLVKTYDFSQFTNVVNAFKGFWIWMAEAPDVTRSANSRVLCDEDTEIRLPSRGANG